MAKKNNKSKKKDNKKENQEVIKTDETNPAFNIPNIPADAQAKLQDIKKKLDVFAKKVVEKFESYVVGVSLLPPPQPEDGEEINKDLIHTLVLIDDSDSQKMTKEELKDKLGGIIEQMAKEIDPNLAPRVVILTELWGYCYDAKYDLLQMIAISAPIYENGMLSAIKIAELHKSMVLKKFEKYIVSYVLAGSLVQGKATRTSDIDVWIVIDDTDVKKMTRAELKDKLRAIIIGMGIEAGEMTGIKNKLNIQVYILTDFWDSLKEANPVIFTLLRDGVPFYDRGIFMPWKQLLRMGKIKPSPEAIDMFMGSGEQMLERVSAKIRDIGMEDTFWAILTPSQAALMMYGIAPPTPKETPQLMGEIFVKKEKMLEKKYVDILERNIRVRKELEHGIKKELSGQEVDKLLNDAKDYLKRVNKLFEDIQEKKQVESMLDVYDNVVTVIRDVLKLEGYEKVSDKKVVEHFESELIHSGKIPERFLRMLKGVMKSKQDYDKGKLTRQEVESVKKDSSNLIKFLVEYMQRKRGRELERVKIRIKHGETFGEVFMFDKVAFIIRDIDAEEKSISKAPINKDGSLGITEDTNLEEFEKYLADVKIPGKVFIKEPVFENLRKIFGKDVEILMN